MQNIWLAFATGLTMGGISCLAIQGGLLTSSITQQREKSESSKGNWKYVAMFLASKLVAYTILGFLLGYLGSFLVLSLKMQAIIQLLVGFFLIGTAGKLLNLHPVFRYFSITPPKFVFKLARSESKSKSVFAPVLLGALTVLMPCGVTQAMMAVALATANPIYAAAIMFAFVLGTSPVFFALGVAATKALKNRSFAYVAASVVFVFGILSLNGAMGLLGSTHTLQNYWFVIKGGSDIGFVKSASVSASGIQEVTINVTNNSYETEFETLKVGIPVRLTLKTQNTRGCSRAFTIPSLNVSKILPETGEEIIEFTPTKEGRLAYSCSMGMYTGSFQVIP